MSKTIREPRNEDDLLEALSDNLNLLKDAIEKAQSGDFKYIKSIKGILRILVHTGGTNKPLLIEMAKKNNVKCLALTHIRRDIRKNQMDLIKGRIAKEKIRVIVPEPLDEYTL